MSSSAAESDASTSTIRGKRRRTEDDVGPPPPPAGPSTIPDPKGKGKTVVPPVNNHAIPAVRPWSKLTSAIGTDGII